MDASKLDETLSESKKTEADLEKIITQLKQAKEDIQNIISAMDNLNR